ncbi:MAG: DUF421 domain-containing protein [Bacteroides sp.]|nr:DUF421 domain-containing protein [Eubacterium sp.]MCM1419231.1 DUF421 domain-containing protein [Roseburia sp.]MCM1463095.1 DUF421 domain-containing protein [Bacteroides sp.]
MLIILIRTLILFILVILSLRLMGKKQLGELQPSELVTTILISNIATLSIEDPSIPMLTGIVPILMIVCTDVLMSGIMLKNTRFRRVVTGSPKVIISNGKLDRAEMKTLRYTIDDVLESMRDADIFDINEVQYAIVETTGKINFFKKSDGTSDPPSVIVKDGLVVHDGLKQAGLGIEWLNDTLKKRNTDTKSVFLLTAKGDGTYTLILKENLKEK